VTTARSAAAAHPTAELVCKRAASFRTQAQVLRVSDLPMTTASSLRAAVWLGLVTTCSYAHSNLVAVFADQETADTCTVLLVIGTYHRKALLAEHLPPEGAVSLFAKPLGYSYSCSADAAQECTVEVYGNGGAESSASNILQMPFDKAGIVWGNSGHVDPEIGGIPVKTPWSISEMSNVGWTINDEMTAGDVLNFQQVQINGVVAGSYLVQYDDDPVGAEGASELSDKWEACSSTCCSGCQGFRMDTLIINVDNGCQVGVTGVDIGEVVGDAPPNPPPEPSPPAPPLPPPALPPGAPAIRTRHTHDYTTGPNDREWDRAHAHIVDAHSC